MSSISVESPSLILSCCPCSHTSYAPGPENLTTKPCLHPDLLSRPLPAVSAAVFLLAAANLTSPPVSSLCIIFRTHHCYPRTEPWLCLWLYISFHAAQEGLHLLHYFSPTAATQDSPGLQTLSSNLLQTESASARCSSSSTSLPGSPGLGLYSFQM